MFQVIIDALGGYFSHPALWVAVLIIGTLGDVVKKLVLPGPMPKDGWPGWRGVYYVTYKAHALAVGALMGLIPGLPVSDAFETEGPAGPVLFYAGAGAIAMIGYAALVGTIKNAIENRKAKRGD